MAHSRIHATLFVVILFAGSIESRDSTDFYKLGAEAHTDKVLNHHYDRAYNKYLHDRRMDNLKLLEIGLGCNMQYGAGHSLQLWTEYLPYSDIYFMELDGKCVDKHKDIWFAAHKRLKQIYVGDQGDKFDLQKIVNDHPAKDFDVIVDDGGHSMHQQLLSFEILWPLVRPGGIFVVEDLITSYDANAHMGGGTIGKKGTMVDFIKSAIDYLHCSYQDETNPAMAVIRPFCNPNKVEGLLSFECFTSICVFTKANPDGTAAQS